MTSRHGKIDSEIVVDILAKSAIGLIPYVGSFLSEIVTYRSQVKQKRLLQFVEQVDIYLEAMGGVDQAALSSLNGEQFGDLLESIVCRVAQTSSEHKTKRFAHILVNHIQTTVDEDYTETFLDMVTHLSEKQIEILNAFCDAGDQYKIRESVNVLERKMAALDKQLRKESNRSFQGWANNYDKCQRDMAEAQRKLFINRALINENDKIQHSGYYDVSEEHYQF